MNLILRILSLCIITCLFNSKILATHIVGGNIQFTSSQSGIYQFTLKAYKECDSGQNHFDSSPQTNFIASVTVYLGDSLFIPSIYLLPPVINEYSSDGLYPCKILPEDICFEEAVYNFEANLPPSDSAYTIIYQRCCLENGIVNIDNVTSSGLSIYTVILPEGQIAQNNSAEFVFEPIGVLCNDEIIEFGYQLIDIDGDSLSYKFCTPLSEMMEDDVVDPEPPPPYNLATFNAPDYTTNSPLAGAPIVKIDPNNGQFSGIPNLLGPHFFGVCVEEYRNGQLIHISQFDYVLNVVECPDLINAQIEADLIDENQQELLLCDFDGNVLLENTSTDTDFIFGYEWNLFLSGGTETFTTENVNLELSTPENFQGTMVANPGEECVDTVFFEVFTSPELLPEIEIIGDTCQENPISFSINTNPEHSIAINNYMLEYGDGNIDSSQQNTHLYTASGIYEVLATVIDTNGCEATSTKTFSYYPIQDEIQFSQNTQTGCTPLTINFALDEVLPDNYEIDWDFGDGNSQIGNFSNNTYTKAGNYPINLTVTSPSGCTDSFNFQNHIQVDEFPIADFIANPMTVDIFEPIVEFENNSVNATSFEWIFEGNQFDQSVNPNYTFTTPGKQPVVLIANSALGCADTLVGFITVTADISYFLPNAFTPNYDGQNDLFLGKGQLSFITDFQMEIFNRYGEAVFMTIDPTKGWNGKKNNIGAKVQQGMYTYMVRFSTSFSEPQIISGNVMLLY